MNLFRLAALLLVIPLLDALFLVFVASQIGALVTALLVVLTALLGMLLVRAESRHTIREIQKKIGVGELPTDELLDGGLLLVAGALTMTPGLVTDFVGILLIVPITRIPIRTAVRDYVVVPYIDEKTDGFGTGQVYVGGSPFENDEPSEADAGSPYDLDEDAYDVDFDDDGDSETDPAPGFE
jgi:UPF0716 protein FxsA